MTVDINALLKNKDRMIEELPEIPEVDPFRAEVCNVFGEDRYLILALGEWSVPQLWCKDEKRVAEYLETALDFMSVQFQCNSDQALAKAEQWLESEGIEPKACTKEELATYYLMHDEWRKKAIYVPDTWVGPWTGGYMVRGHSELLPDAGFASMDEWRAAEPKYPTDPFLGEDPDEMLVFFLAYFTHLKKYFELKAQEAV